jgi:hypothetical protein
MTSPPYLIAIDYLRGHRMSLVWMGYRLKDLRRLRSSNIGSHRGSCLAPELQAIADSTVTGTLPAEKLRIMNTYIADMEASLREMARVLRPSGRATFVVANSKHSAGGVSVETVISAIASRNGLTLNGRRERDLPQTMRYLPPPRQSEGAGEGAALDKRMHTEVVLTFARDLQE